MRIYFAGSISGGRDDWNTYRGIIALLSNHGTVLTEHVGDAKISITGEDLDDAYIHDRDLEWLRSCDCVVAEVTRPSLGVGYEIGRATEWGKSVLCLYRPSITPRLSAMISGCNKVTLQSYEQLEDLKSIFVDHFSNPHDNCS